MKNPLAYWLGRIIIGCVLVAIALFLKGIDETSASIVAVACKAGPDSLSCAALSFLLVKLGLSGLWMLLLVIGLFLILVYDWLASQIRDIAQYAIETSTNISSVASGQIARDRVPRAELRQMFGDILGHVGGQQEALGREFADFVFDGISSRAAPVWKRNSVIQVIIEDLPATSPLRDQYFSFIQSESFTLVCATPGHAYTVPVDAEIEAEPNQIEQLVKDFGYQVKLPDQTIELRPLALGEYDRIRNGERVPAGRFFTWYYERGLLVLQGRIEISIKDKEVSVATSEQSLLLRKERDYIKILNEPVKGLAFRLRVPDGYEVVLCYASVSRFAWHPGQKLGQVVEFGGRDANVTAPWWALPGIAAAVTWREAAAVQPAAAPAAAAQAPVAPAAAAQAAAAVLTADTLPAAGNAIAEEEK